MSTRSIPLDWLPTIPRRYATTVIDGLLILAVFVVPTTVLPDIEFSRVLRIIGAGAMLFLYDPIGTGRYVTLGQWITGVRVRDFKTGQPIGIPRAWGRIIVKALLGIISFLMIPFSGGRRAVHDIATGSIVVLAKSENDFARWAQEPEGASLEGQAERLT